MKSFLKVIFLVCIVCGNIKLVHSSNVLSAVIRAPLNLILDFAERTGFSPLIHLSNYSTALEGIPLTVPSEFSVFDSRSALDLPITQPLDSTKQYESKNFGSNVFRYGNDVLRQRPDYLEANFPLSQINESDPTVMKSMMARLPINPGNVSRDFISSNHQENNDSLVESSRSQRGKRELNEIVRTDRMWDWENISAFFARLRSLDTDGCVTRAVCEAGSEIRLLGRFGKSILRFLRNDISNDDEYWAKSEQKGYNFEDDNEEAYWASFSKKEAAELSETVRQQTTSASVPKDTSPSSRSGSIGEADDSEVQIIFGSQQQVLVQKRLETLQIKPKVSVGTSIAFEPPKETVKKIINGQPYFLEQYKSKEDKLELLDEAIASCDGNAVTAATLLLKKTLKPTLFNNELMKRPLAINQYVSYLRHHQEHAELADLLSMLGRNEEAAMLKYKMAISVNQPETKIVHLKNCQQTHFLSDPSLVFWTNLIQHHIGLLEIQLPIEEEDNRQERERTNVLFKQFPRKSTVVDKSLITTLYYCCLYHYGIPENQFASPMYLQKRFQLTQKQYVWTALSALAQHQRWREIDSLFQVKSWLGGMKMKASIGFNKVSQVLHKAKAPEEVVMKYLKLIEDTEERVELAKKYKLHALVIETLIYLRDRQALEAYRPRVEPQTKEYAYLQDALRASTIKWKN